MSRFLTASFDKFVIYRDAHQDTYLKKFSHQQVVTSISFYPIKGEERFASGSMDKMIRIWSIDNNIVMDYLNCSDFIISIAYSPDGNHVSAGNQKGKVSIHEFKEDINKEKKLQYSHSFNCKNGIGRFSKGRKIISIQYITRHLMLVTTSDSRLRLVNEKVDT